MLLPFDPKVFDLPMTRSPDPPILLFPIREWERKDPENESHHHAASGSSLETPVLTCSVRDGFHYTFWVYILGQPDWYPLHRYDRLF